MAFLHSDGIPKDLFQDAEWKHVTSLKRHSLVVDCPTLGGVSMHALTQKVVRELLMGDSKATALGGVLETLDAKMSKFRLDRPATYFVGRRYVRHVKAAALHAQDCPARQDTVLATVCHSAGVFLSEISCSFAEALEMHHISVSARSRAYGPDDVDVANTYNNMAAIYEKQGQYVEALELYEKSQAIMIKARGHDYVAVARTYGNMADVYYKQGKNTEAQVLFEKSKEIRIKALGPDHVDVAATCTNIANIYKEQG
ncbi:Tetratricopeptide repeat-domain-containing protein, partial [Baffinella frigidus]